MDRVRKGKENVGSGESDGSHAVRNERVLPIAVVVASKSGPTRSPHAFYRRAGKGAETGKVMSLL